MNPSPRSVQDSVRKHKHCLAETVGLQRAAKRLRS
ncbi:unnamed protein product [Ectocarpus sp. 12 AP-2014]